MELALGAVPEEHAPLEFDLEDAERHIPGSPESELRHFAVRQLRARRRLTDLAIFYRANPCRLAHLHLLGAAAVALGRFCGFSALFDEMGDAFMPVTADGTPRTAAWKAFADACSTGQPVTSRDELWLNAHLLDLASVRARGMEGRFVEEAGGKKDPTYRLLCEHMAIALRARLMAVLALPGEPAHETAVAQTLPSALARLIRSGFALIRRYASETARALLEPSEPRRAILSNRQTAALLLSQLWFAFRARRIYRNRLRARERDLGGEGERWLLLEDLLGDRAREVHPLIARFYANPSRFQVRASLELRSGAEDFWSRAATLLLGQGAGESDGEFEARFRALGRADGSTQLVRELIADGKPRVFDSDFVVRTHKGKPALFEVFVDKGIDVELRGSSLEGGGLSLRGDQVRIGGLRVPGLRVEFNSVVRSDEGEGEIVHIEGLVRMQSGTRLGELLIRKLIRRPEQLARIHYRARELRPARNSGS